MFVACLGCAQEVLRLQRLERERKEKAREGALFVQQAEAARVASGVAPVDAGYSSMFNAELVQRNQERKAQFQEQRQRMAQRRYYS